MAPHIPRNLPLSYPLNSFTVPRLDFSDVSHSRCLWKAFDWKFFEKSTIFSDTKSFLFHLKN
jgi:hypothetical protein